MNVKTSVEMSKDIHSPEQLITEHIDIWTSAILAKSSSGRGSSKKYELYGITKLRELILELAVHGKLVPQDANDEPASVLMERIAVEKAQLIKEKLIKKTKPLSIISNDEKYFELPEGWAWIRVADFAEIKGGKRLPKGHSLLDKKTKYPYIRVTDMKNGSVDIESLRYLLPETQKLIEKYTISKNDLYITIAGTIGAIGSIPDILDGANLTENAAKIVFTKVNKGWLQKILCSRVIQSQFSDKTNQLAQPKLALHRISSTVIALPPISEQQRVAEKVDELMLLCDQLEQQTEASINAHATLVEVLLATLIDSADADELAQNWERVSEHFGSLFTTEKSIKALKQTVLQLAVMGKLVPQNTEDESASVLLEKIAREKEQLIKDKKIKKEKPLPVITSEEKPFELQTGWEWCRFGLLFKSLTNGLYKPEKFYSDTGVISLRMYNIQDGLIDFDSARRVNIDDTEIDKYLLEEGDLLINRVNSKELVGKTAIIPRFQEPLVYESMNMRGRVFTDYLNSSYLNLFMRSEFAKSALIEHAKEAVGQASINQGQIRSLLTPLPPLSQQNDIVAKVDELMAICDQLKVKLQQSQETQVQLTDALVDRALG